MNPERKAETRETNWPQKAQSLSQLLIGAMNCIYQGKVTAVTEILDCKNEQGKPLDLDVLWRHHELFQDAVNS